MKLIALSKLSVAVAILTFAIPAVVFATETTMSDILDPIIEVRTLDKTARVTGCLEVNIGPETAYEIIPEKDTFIHVGEEGCGFSFTDNPHRKYSAGEALVIEGKEPWRFYVSFYPLDSDLEDPQYYPSFVISEK